MCTLHKQFLRLRLILISLWDYFSSDVFNLSNTIQCKRTEHLDEVSVLLVGGGGGTCSSGGTCSTYRKWFGWRFANSVLFFPPLQLNNASLICDRDIHNANLDHSWHLKAINTRQMFISYTSGPSSIIQQIISRVGECWCRHKNINDCIVIVRNFCVQWYTHRWNILALYKWETGTVRKRPAVGSTTAPPCGHGNT